MWFVTITYHTRYNTYHMGLGSNLDQERKDVCTQIINYTAWACIICNHFNKQTVLLLLFHQHYIGGLHMGNLFYMVSIYVDDPAVVTDQHLSLPWSNVSN